MREPVSHRAHEVPEVVAWPRARVTDLAVSTLYVARLRPARIRRVTSLLPRPPCWVNIGRLRG